jgi:hypothetical protein
MGAKIQVPSNRICEALLDEYMWVLVTAMNGERATKQPNLELYSTEIKT